MEKFLVFLVLFSFFSCEKNDENINLDPKIRFKVNFDSNLPRLGNLGQIVSVPPQNGSQNPNVDEVLIHYIELAKDSLTPLLTGEILYTGYHTTIGGDTAIDFDSSPISKNNEIFLELDLNNIEPGEYNWIRVSLAYQKFEINYRVNSNVLENYDAVGTFSSFVGYNTYITSHQIYDSIVNVNQNKTQGFWMFETSFYLPEYDYTFGSVSQGDGVNVTVVNPISSTSPIPEGSCVVTGKFDKPLNILQSNDDDINVTLSFSTNNSFEWLDLVPDGKYEPLIGEEVLDMGLRGLHPIIE